MQFLNLVNLKRIYRIPRQLVILTFGKNNVGSERWLIEKEKIFAPNVVKIPAVFSEIEEERALESLNHGGDKMSAQRHGYAKTYSQILKSLPEQGAMLEVGVLTGISLAIWSQVKPKWKIFGLDLSLDRFLENLSFLKSEGAFSTQDPTVLKFDCYTPDTDELNERMLESSISGFDLIIDDGPHTDNAILATFKELFPLTTPAGSYVVEDNLTVKRKLAALASDFDAVVTRQGDLLVVIKRIF